MNPGCRGGVMRMVSCLFWVWLVLPVQASTLVVATVDNEHMLRLQELSTEFEKSHPDIRLRWVVLNEHALRQVVSAHMETQGGLIDVMTIGMFEAPIWAARGWLKPIRPGPEYVMDDLLPVVREALSYNGIFYAAPFYGESSVLMYRKDLMHQAGLSMPDLPTWTEVADFAARLHDPSNGVYGICLRGSPGWGENMALVTTMVNVFGGQWFDMSRNPQLHSPPWHSAVSLYVDLLRQFGPPDAASRGYNENLALFQAGQCAQWVDATVAAGFITDSALSQVAHQVGFAAAPSEVTHKGANWLWAWALAIPNSIDPAREAAAQAFVQWATSRNYIELVAAEKGWAAVPSGTRTSTYADPDFRRNAPWAERELSAMLSANPADATLSESPYTGIQFAMIPEFRTIGDEVGRLMVEALEGRVTVDEALERSQRFAERQLLLRGYLR